MLGNNRKVDIQFINNIYKVEKIVQFHHVEHVSISILYEHARRFSKEIRIHYEHEDFLHEVFLEVRKILNRFFITFDHYAFILDDSLPKLLEHFKNIKVHYPDLFDSHCKPIALNVRKIQLQNEKVNFLQDEVASLLKEKKKTCIVTRYDSQLKEFNGVPVIRASAYLKEGIFYDQAFIIGSPEFFDRRLSKVFLAKETTFICYNIFQNKIKKQKTFQHIKKKDTFNTIYGNVRISNGFIGQSFNVDFGQTKEEVFQKNEIMLKHENAAKDLKDIDKVEANLIVLRNNYYTFVPVDSKLRKIDRETLKLSKEPITHIGLGDWLLFRNHTKTDLIIEVANKIIGEEHIGYRKWQAKWKTRLRNTAQKRGTGPLIDYLINKGVTTSNLQNLKNWIKEDSIYMNEFEQLLTALNFNEEERKMIHSSSQELRSKHIHAGRVITSKLLDELDDRVIDNLLDNGYATFTSPLLEGASFNIEEVEEVDRTPILIDYKDIFTIWGS